MGLGHTGTGTQVDRTTAGPGHNMTGAQQAWDTIGPGQIRLGRNRNGTPRDRDTTGLEDNGA